MAAGTHSFRANFNERPATGWAYLLIQLSVLMFDVSKLCRVIWFRVHHELRDSCRTIAINIVSGSFSMPSWRNMFTTWAAVYWV